MLRAAAEQFGSKSTDEITFVAKETLEGHQRAIMGTMTVEEIYRDRKQFARTVLEVASTDLVNMGITIVSYTIKDISDDVGYLQVKRLRMSIITSNSAQYVQGREIDRQTHRRERAREPGRGEGSNLLRPRDLVASRRAKAASKITIHNSQMRK